MSESFCYSLVLPNLYDFWVQWEEMFYRIRLKCEKVMTDEATTDTMIQKAQLSFDQMS